MMMKVTDPHHHSVKPSRVLCALYYNYHNDNNNTNIIFYNYHVFTGFQGSKRIKYLQG